MPWTLPNIGVPKSAQKYTDQLNSALVPAPQNHNTGRTKAVASVAVAPTSGVTTWGKGVQGGSNTGGSNAGGSNTGVASSYDPAAAQRAAQEAQEEAQRGQLRAQASGLINTLIGAYDSLFGSARSAAKAQNEALDSRYTKEVGGLTDQFNQELPKIGRGYAARGTFDSSYRGDAEDQATTGFKNQIDDIGTQREADAAKIGQFVAEKEGMVNAEKGLLAKMLGDLPNVTDINELTQLRQQIDRKIADTQSAQAGVQSEAAYRAKLNEVAPSADRMAGLQSTLSNIVNGAAPGPLKRAVAQQVIGSSGLSDEEKQALLGQVNSQIV
jgi:hypothetical protein